MLACLGPGHGCGSMHGCMHASTPFYAVRDAMASAATGRTQCIVQELRTAHRHVQQTPPPPPSSPAAAAALPGMVCRGDVLVMCVGLVWPQDSEALRKAVEEVQPENVKLGLRLAQSKPLYQVGTCTCCAARRGAGPSQGVAEVPLSC